MDQQPTQDETRLAKQSAASGLDTARETCVLVSTCEVSQRGLGLGDHFSSCGALTSCGVEYKLGPEAFPGERVTVTSPITEVSGPSPCFTYTLCSKLINLTHKESEMALIRCKCRDKGCPCGGACLVPAEEELRRADLADSSPIPFCQGCGEDAFETGLFVFVRTILNEGEERATFD